MTRRHPAMLGTGLAAALALASIGAAAASAGKEAQIAARHARYAAESTALETVRTHLHHAVNCLVGPNGPGFDRDVLNPCKGMGQGAIPDAKTEESRRALGSALELAKAGLATRALTVAQDDAQRLAELLEKAD